MAENKRIFYAVQAVGLAPKNSTAFVAVHGLQSVSVTTTFNLEQVFEIGEIKIYENIENIPDVEMTLEKVIDGYPLLYHLTTRGAPSTTLVGRSQQQCVAALSIYGDTQDSASGVPVTQLEMSGLYLSSVNYSFPLEGNFTESITLIGNNKVWRSSNFTYQPSFLNTDTPLALASGLGGVQRRENMLFNSLIDGSVTILPSGAGGLPGISSSGTNDLDADGFRRCRLADISISCDLGREAIYEQGHKAPYYRFANFPIEVTTEINITSTSGDLIAATEAGVAGNGNNLFAQRILFVLEDTTKIDLGSQNKLSSVSYGGADAGGGNANMTFTYTTFNDFLVTHQQDPT